MLASVGQVAELYPTPESRRELAGGFGLDPTLAALYGRAFDLSTIGGIVAWRYSLIATIFVPLLCVFTVIRHTRAEEEAGRGELLGSTAIGRRAPLTAALVVAFAAALVVGMLIALGLIARGESAIGSLAFGLAITSGGWMFAAIAAVSAQLTTYARPARGIAVGVLGAAYLLRAAGDAAGEHGPAWLSWLSPLGWTQQVRPFAGERWWVFGLAASLVAVLTGAAYTLAARRDVGAGLLPTRLGPAAAPRSLGGPLGLAWRLERASLLAWTLGLFVAGAVLGSLAAGIEKLADDSPQVKEQLTRLSGSGTLADAFLATIMLFFGMIAAAYAVQATLRLRNEETESRAELMLATPVTRIRWAASHLVFALAAVLIPLLAAGLGTGIAHGRRIHDIGGQVPRLLGSALVQLPAAWVFAGIALVLFGLLPRLTVPGGWAVLAASAVIGLYGPILKLDQSVIDVSAFAHVPKVPGAELTLTPLVWLTAITVVLQALGVTAFRRRDVPG